MGKIRIATMTGLKSADPAGAGEAVSQGVRTEAIFEGSAAPVHARWHHVPVGATIDWTDSATGHIIYVWQGAVEVGSIRLEQGSVIVVEHRASAGLRAQAGGAILLLFNRAASKDAPALAGGHVHILPDDRVPRIARLNDRSNVGAAIFADSACPTCDLWLHESSFHDADLAVALHSHSEDEIIVVTRGEIVLGKRRYGPGTAIAVGRDVLYGFGTGHEGLEFINFRASHPTYKTADGKTVIDEQALYRDALGRPPYVEAK